jgi:hypothetical protein
MPRGVDVFANMGMRKPDEPQGSHSRARWIALGVLAFVFVVADTLGIGWSWTLAGERLGIFAAVVLLALLARCWWLKRSASTRGAKTR